MPSESSHLRQNVLGHHIKAKVVSVLSSTVIETGCSTWSLTQKLSSLGCLTFRNLITLRISNLSRSLYFFTWFYVLHTSHSSILKHLHLGNFWKNPVYEFFKSFLGKDDCHEPVLLASSKMNSCYHVDCVMTVFKQTACIRESQWFTSTHSFREGLFTLRFERQVCL